VDDPTPAPQLPPDEHLALGLRRWRTLLGGAVLALAMVAVVGFVVERMSVARTAHTGTVLSVASNAQRLAWRAESNARSYLISRDTVALQATQQAYDSIGILLDELDALEMHSMSGMPHVDSLRASMADWHAAFEGGTHAQPSGVLSSTLDRTASFDRVMQHFGEFLADEWSTRNALLSTQNNVAWFSLSVLLVSLLAAGVAGARLTRGLQVDAELTIERQRRIEDQAVELEQQAMQLEEQASQLEDQSAELRERIIERDETNRLLQQTATFLDSALESAPFGIVFYDRGYRYQRINNALAAMNGQSPEAHIGRRVDEMVPEIAQYIRPVLERVLKTGVAESNVAFEGETRAKPGERRRWLSTYYPIVRTGELPVGVGVMVLDVTEQHRLEQQLRQAQKLEAVGRLAGGIAHDFNNVLTVIQSYAEVLAVELEGSKRGHEEVEAIRAAADRAAALARQLLAFSRRDVIIPRDLDLANVVRGLDLILRRLLRQGVELQLDLHSAPLIVRMDAGQLEQVLMNLAINAVDAMPDGGVLRIRTWGLSGLGARGGRAVLSVEDTGTGMTAEVQERLFEPFFTTKPAGRGTGLGLATGYAIVKEAGGEITVTTAPGRGSRFDVILPLSISHEPDSGQRMSPVYGSVQPGAGERILLVEDEPAIRTALSRILHASGYEVLEASNGGEALRLADAEPAQIHLLLTDVMMPGIGGKELVQRLLEQRPDTRVILMSGFTDDADLRADLGSARFLFLQKPFATRRVLSAIREALDLS
jgi:two-component system cell cycle sensor histidine kinase/response regulator CckA